MCRVRLVLEAYPFFSNCIVLVLSCSMTTSLPIFFNTESSLIDLICCSTNSCIHSTKYIASSTPTSSASVELFVLIFCFNDIDISAPCPNDRTAPYDFSCPCGPQTRRPQTISIGQYHPTPVQVGWILLALDI
jgi:hypothetical protein